MIEPGASVVALVRMDGIAYFTGEVVRDDAHEIILRRVIWHSQTGRHSEFFAGSPSLEREPYPPGTLVRLSRHAVISVVDYPGDLDAERA